MNRAFRKNGNTKFFMYHKSENSHHGSTSVVELDGTLAHLGLFIKGIPTVVKAVIAEVSREFSASDVLHYRNLKETHEGDKLVKSSAWDGSDRLESTRDVGKGV